MSASLIGHSRSSAGLVLSWRNDTLLGRRWRHLPVLLLKENLFCFVVDSQQPCFGAVGAIAEMCEFGLCFPHSLFGTTQFERKSVSSVHGADAIFLRRFGGFLQQRNNGTPCLFDHDIRCLSSWRDRNDGDRLVGRMLTHGCSPNKQAWCA